MENNILIFILSPVYLAKKEECLPIISTLIYIICTIFTHLIDTGQLMTFPISWSLITSIWHAAINLVTQLNFMLLFAAR